MELIFALFYLSGIMKSLFEFYQISFPIDFTIIITFFMFAYLIFQYRNEKIKLTHNRYNLYAVLFLFLFYIWILVTLTYTPSPSYSYVKTLNFAPNIVAFLIPLLSYKFNIRRFVKLITIGVIILSLMFLVLFLKYYKPGENTELYESIGGLYLVCSTLLGINALLLACSPEPIFKNVYLNVFFILATVILMFVLGARGPLIFAVLILVAFYIWKFLRVIFIGKIDAKAYKTVIAIIVFALFFLVLFFAFHDEIMYLVKRALMRLNLLVPAKSTANMGNSVNVRVEQLDLSIHLIFNNLNDFLFGNGIGSFGLLEKGYDHRSYPHNIFLEIWVELGFVGLVIFLLFLFQIFRKNGTQVKYISMLVLFYMLLNSMKSSSFIDIRVFFAIFGLYILNENKSEFISDSHSTT